MINSFDILQKYFIKCDKLGDRFNKRIDQLLQIQLDELLCHKNVSQLFSYIFNKMYKMNVFTHINGKNIQVLVNWKQIGVKYGMSFKNNAIIPELQIVEFQLFKSCSEFSLDIKHNGILRCKHIKGNLLIYFNRLESTSSHSLHDLYNHWTMCTIIN